MRKNYFLYSMVIHLILSSVWGCEEPQYQQSQDNLDMALLGDMFMESTLDLSIDMLLPSSDLAIIDAGQPDDMVGQVELFPSRDLPISTRDLSRDDRWHWGRGLIHMHSVHSHDACDGDPKPNGEINQACFDDLRAAVCSSRLDFMLLTDHPTSFNEVSFAEACLYQADLGDELIMDTEQRVVGNRLRCPDGHQVLIAPGSEGEIMPVMLTQVPSNTNWFGERSVEAVNGLREAGAVMLHAHTEQRSFEELWPIGLDGFEIYNLHANVNPRGEQLREVISDLTTTLRSGSGGPHPDLSVLAILRANRWALDIWDLFIPYRKQLGFAGSDIHQNIPQSLFQSPDGERLDSYRRLTQWFANYLLLSEYSLEAIRDALMSGRLYTIFHILGEPKGLDYYLLDQIGTRYEMGSELTFQENLTLYIKIPEVPLTSQAQIKVYQITKQAIDDEPGRPIVKNLIYESEIGNNSPGEIQIAVNSTGAYRFEISLVPEHLRPELGNLADLLIRPTIWIYSNPIYIRD